MLYEAEKETALAIAQSLNLPAIEDQFRAIEGPKMVDTWKYTNKNSIMYVPDGVELTKEEQLEMAKQKQAIDYCNTRFRANPFNEQQSKEQIAELAKTQVSDLDLCKTQKFLLILKILNFSDKRRSYRYRWKCTISIGYAKCAGIQFR